MLALKRPACMGYITHMSLNPLGKCDRIIWDHVIYRKSVLISPQDSVALGPGTPIIPQLT